VLARDPQQVDRGSFVVTIAIALASRDSWKRSARFFGATLAASLFLFAVLQWASAGRFAENLQATLRAGTHVSDLWRRGIPMLLWQLLGDPLIGGPFALAAWSVFIAARLGDWSVADSYFVTAALVTCVIYASPGTSSNHMIEVQVATACAVAVGVGRGRLTDRVVVTTYGALAVIMIALGLPPLWMPSPMRTLRLLGPHQRSTIEAVQADFLSSNPYLSLDPIVPVLLHQRPIVLDPFNLGLFVVGNTPAGRNFDSRIHSRSFATVIADDDEGVFVRDLDQGSAGFAEAVARFWAASTPLIKLIGNDYEIRAVRRPFVILQPRGGGDVYLGNGS
jgi:hypothetical protein